MVLQQQLTLKSSRCIMLLRVRYSHYHVIAIWRSKAFGIGEVQHSGGMHPLECLPGAPDWMIGFLSMHGKFFIWQAVIIKL